MSTETRIGIVAGLLIVVVASVYFFYGNRQASEDVLVVTNLKSAEPLKIPPTNDRPQSGSQSQTKTPSVLPSGKPARDPGLNPSMQLSRYQSPSPARPADSVQSRVPVQVIDPPKDSAGQAIDKYRQAVLLDPMESSAPLLRTSASALLVDATNDNLHKEPVAGVPTPAGQSVPAKREVLNDSTMARNTADSPSGRVTIAPERDDPVTRPRPVSEKPAAATSTPLAEKTYTVKPGDTLYGIARDLYHNSVRWEEIFAMNKAQLRNDPKRLRPGMVLKLPAE